MQDMWFGPELPDRDIGAIDGALALHGGRHSPSLGFTGSKDEPATLLFASRAFLSLFAVDAPEALGSRIMSGRDAGSRRLAALRTSLPLDGATRLERLRFTVGGVDRIVTFLCRRTAFVTGKPLFLAAAIGLRADPAQPAARAPDVAREDLGQAPIRDPIQDPLHHPRLSDARHATPVAESAAEAIPEPASDVSAVLTDQVEPGMPVGEVLRLRWPQGRSARFVWQTDAAGHLLSISPPLAAIVGPANGDLVGRRFGDLADQLDPSGRLRVALQEGVTWSGIDVAWPVEGYPAAVKVSLGGVALGDAERAFDGFRGYGVIRIDEVVDRRGADLTGAPVVGEAPHVPESPSNVVAFPRNSAGRGLSPEEQIAFAALAAELRDRAGFFEGRQPAPDSAERTQPSDPAQQTPPAEPERLETESLQPLALQSSGEGEEGAPAPEPPHVGEAPEPQPHDAAVPLGAALAEEPGPTLPGPMSPDASQASEPQPALSRAEDVARNGLCVLDRLSIGLLVSRDNIPIFANRHLLDLLGFADEDELHAMGGLAHVFGDQPSNTTGSETVGVRTRSGSIAHATARMQRIEWDGLPATLLTLQPVADSKAAPRPQPTQPPGDGAQLRALQARADELAQRERDLEQRHEANSLLAAAAIAEHEEFRQRTDGDLRQLRAILETATDGVVVIDAGGKILSLNRAGEALFGCERAAVIGLPFTGLFAPHNRGLAEDYLDGLKSNPTRSLLNDGRDILIQAPGGTIPVFMTMGALPGPEPSARHFCALFRDLTHWKKVEADLETAKVNAERASAMKSDFLAKVSHEVRTPLNAIIGFAEVMMEERFGPIGNERYRDYLRDIHSSGTHVMSLVNDLLDLSKIEAGKMDLAVEAIDANRIVGDCVTLMQPQASRERVIMRLSLASSLPRIQADERSMRQIVLNILSNAVKFNEPGGQVIVSTALLEDGHVVIRIRDTGPGMSDTDILAALEPFRQLSTSRPGGTGLGLPLTKALVEANHAAFTIRSKVDQGTLVEVSFPPARVLAT